VQHHVNSKRVSIKENDNTVTYVKEFREGKEDVMSEDCNALENTMVVTDYTNGKTHKVPDNYRPSAASANHNNNQASGSEEEGVFSDSEFNTVGVISTRNANIINSSEVFSDH
jgi:hypothetical protein